MLSEHFVIGLACSFLLHLHALALTWKTTSWDSLFLTALAKIVHPFPLLPPRLLFSKELAEYCLCIYCLNCIYCFLPECKFLEGDVFSYLIITFSARRIVLGTQKIYVGWLIGWLKHVTCGVLWIQSIASPLPPPTPKFKCWSSNP